MKKILIAGSNGMLGHSLYRYFSRKEEYEVKGTTRSKPWNDLLLTGFSVDRPEKFEELISEYKPDLVFNCIGVIKQLDASKDYDLSLQVNSMWPHRLAKICEKNNSKLIHFSTDCVFSGDKGHYTELSNPDAEDLYGMTKFLGEVNYKNCLTVRTSIIGHELNSSVSLIDWFLSQQDECKGFTNAIYSGFPTNSLARIIDEYLIEKFCDGKIFGTYHLSSHPINKYDLLQLIAKTYGKSIEVIPFDDFRVDRSLDSKLLRNIVGYHPENWDFLVDEMHELYKELQEEK